MTKICENYRYHCSWERTTYALTSTGYLLFAHGTGQISTFKVVTERKLRKKSIYPWISRCPRTPHRRVVTMKFSCFVNHTHAHQEHTTSVHCSHVIRFMLYLPASIPTAGLMFYSSVASFYQCGVILLRVS